MIYDILWLVFHTRDWWSTVPYDGDMELGLRRFVIIFTIISLVFRTFVFWAYWKAGVDYNKIIGEKKKSMETHTETQSGLTFKTLFNNVKEGYHRQTRV